MTKISRKNTHKCVYKLNKQQTQRWHHLANLFELFFTEIQFWNKVLIETILKKVENFEEKKRRNTSISWISIKPNDGTTYGIYANYL